MEIRSRSKGPQLLLSRMQTGGAHSLIKWPSLKQPPALTDQLQGTVPKVTKKEKLQTYPYNCGPSPLHCCSLSFACHSLAVYLINFYLFCFFLGEVFCLRRHTTGPHPSRVTLHFVAAPIWSGDPHNWDASYLVAHVGTLCPPMDLPGFFRNFSGLSLSGPSNGCISQKLH